MTTTPRRFTLARHGEQVAHHEREENTMQQVSLFATATAIDEPATSHDPDAYGWRNRETYQARSILSGWVKELCYRAYEEKITPAKVERSIRKQYRDLASAFMLEALDKIDFDQLAHGIADEATEFATADQYL